MPLTRLLFQPPRASYTAEDLEAGGAEVVWVPPDPEIGLKFSCPCALYRAPSARYLLIYFHANAEDIGQIGAGLKRIAALLEVHVLAVEFPGFGICPGPVGLGTADAVMRTVFRYVLRDLAWPADSLLVMGRSLGAALAVRAAREFRTAGLVLVAPFRSVRTVIAYHIGELAAMVFPDVLQSAEVIREVTARTIVVHGDRDEVVPLSQAEALYAASGAAQKQLIVKKEQGHNGEVLNDADVLLAMLRMFDLPDYSFTDLVIPPKHRHVARKAARPEERAEDARSSQSTRDTDDEVREVDSFPSSTPASAVERATGSIGV